MERVIETAKNCYVLSEGTEFANRNGNGRIHGAKACVSQAVAVRPDRYRAREARCLHWASPNLIAESSEYFPKAALHEYARMRIHAEIVGAIPQR